MTASTPKSIPPARWLDQPAAGWAVPLVYGFVLIAPVWIMADDLYYFSLFGDDFAYITESRNLRELSANLFEPHNTHVVPLFRLWTFALITISGPMANWPLVFGLASYLALVLAMLVVGRFVRRETGRRGLALASMVLLGVSTVLTPSVRWYSAGQALWAGTAVIVALLFTRRWLVEGGRGRFLAMLIVAAAAPMIWTGGHVAGPACAAYLLASGRAGSRKAAAAMVGLTVVELTLELVMVRSEINRVALIWEEHPELWPRPIQAVLHSFQAMAEELMLGNLGLDATTSALQAILLVGGLVVLWNWSRGGWRPSSLEAAGAAIVVFSYLMAYTFRGNLPFASLRPVRWYHAIPQVGAIVFAAGWFDSIQRRWSLTPPQHLTRKVCLGVIGLAVFLSLLHLPRAERGILATAPELCPREREQFLESRALRYRALHFLDETQRRQYRQLVRLETAQKLCVQRGIGPSSIRRALGRILIPGIPEAQRQSDVVGLLSLPPESTPPRPVALPPELANLLAPEPEVRPFWVDPKDPWPWPR